MSVILDFLNDEAGATAIEYGLIASLVALAGIVAFTSLGGTISGSFANISEDFCEGVGGDFVLTADGTDSCTF